MAMGDRRELAAFERVDWDEISEPDAVGVRRGALSALLAGVLALFAYTVFGGSGTQVPTVDVAARSIRWVTPTPLDVAYVVLAVCYVFLFALPVVENWSRTKLRTKLFGVLTTVLGVAFAYDYYYIAPQPTFDSVSIPVYGYLYWDVYGVEWVFVFSLLVFVCFVLGRLFDDLDRTRTYLSRLRKHPTGALALGYVSFFVLGGAFGNAIVGMPTTFKQVEGSYETFSHQPPVPVWTPFGQTDLFTLVLAAAIALGVVLAAYNRIDALQRPLALAATGVVVGLGTLLAVRFTMYEFLEFGPAIGVSAADSCAGRMTADGCLGTWENPLGTNYVGKGVLPLLFVGFRVSLEVALITSMIMLPIATLVGTFAGYTGGLVDDTLTGYIDIQQTIPAFVAYIVLSHVFGRSLFLLILVFGLLSWGGAARLVRSEVVQRREAEFITAARSAGADDRRIMRDHVLPNVSNTVLTSVTRRIPMLILAEAAIAYLSLNDIMVISLGESIANGLENFPTAWWVSTELTLALALTVLSFSLLGDALRDVLDPRGDSQ
ncbi:ABC transporter permease [Halorubellus sp. JP-L1]|uniref:ABC transporter permease n=1 Tax=Halorubellus sp. JP-L1 TaxID=2715753 RepID=UPI00140D6EED|nr:ABC transporter permease [Halorubellus sp. JP-L1]NHN42342.1 ABC transporter permease [Halorubellus sp. JP-L1]